LKFALLDVEVEVSCCVFNCYCSWAIWDFNL